MSDQLNKQAVINHIDACANDLYERGGIVPAGVLVILRDAIESGGFDADDSEVQQMQGLCERERDIADQLRESQQTTLLRNFQLAKDLEDSMDEVQRLREALQKVAGRLNWADDSYAVREAIELIDQALSPQKGETNG